MSSAFLETTVSDLFHRSAAERRYRGQEFLVVFPGCTSPNLIIGAERLRRCIADQPVETSVGPIPVTLSLGLASADQGEKETFDCEAFLRTADEALYAAKAGGRNRVEAAPVSRAARVQD